MSDVSSQYAPDGKSLVSVSVLGLCGQSDLPARVLQEMRDWFGDQVDDWRHLRTDQIRHALPSQRKTEPRGVREFEGILVCGDHVVSASIEGAISSGKIAAEKILTG
jgi:predicted NAD/FAD-dependent oxidoreductase